MKKSYVLKFLVAFVLFAFWNLNKAHTQGIETLSITQCADVDAVLALIDTVFLAGVHPTQINNISFTGDPGAVGYFSGGQIFGFQVPRGIVMSSGFAGTLDTTNNCESQNSSSSTSGGSDTDLNVLTSLSIDDACIIEFDFKPSGDSVKFNYIFGSEEYHDFVNTQFNDVFGFFLSGPGISGPFTNDAINIAEVPGTHNPVSINNVNCGSAPAGCNATLGGGPGCSYLVDNTQQSQGRFQQIALDAYTLSFVADNGVASCEWFHIKLAIGDAGDAAYDSGVFLEMGSFDPGNISAETDFSHPIINDVLYESCNINEAVIYFSIGSLRNDPYIVPFYLITDSIDGNAAATRDVDYRLDYGNYPGDTIYIEAGKLYDSIKITAYTDDITEGLEHVSIKFNSIMCGGPLGALDTAVVMISDTPDFLDSSYYFSTYCENEITIGFGDSIGGVSPYTYDWYTLGETTDTVQINPSGNNLLIIPCNIFDACQQFTSDTAIIIIPDLIANAGPDKSMCNVDGVYIEGSSPGAQHFLWESFPDDPSLIGQENLDTAWVSPTQVTDYLLTVSDNCTNEDTDSVHVTLDEAVALAGDDQVMCYNDSVTLTANGGEGYSWEWTSVPPDPSIGGQINDQSITISPSAPSTVYTVKVTNDCDKFAFDDVIVTVNPLPNADAGSDNSICMGQAYQLHADGGIDFLWTSSPFDNSLTGQDTLQRPWVVPSTVEPYTYYVQVWDNNQCTNIDSMVLRVDPVPNLSLAVDDDLLCYGESATLSVVGDANYTWTADPSDPTLAGQETNQTITVTPLENTIYTLVGVVAGFDCPATLTQSIEVKPELLSTFDVQADEICQEQTFTVMYTGNASVSANYTWDFDGAQIIAGSGGGPIDISWDTEGLKTITLSVEEDECLSEISSTNVDVLLTPVSGFDSNVQEGCVPFTVDFINTSSNLGSNVSYQWSFGTGDESTDAAPTYTFTQPNLYSVTLVVTNDGKCSNTISQTDYIKANETPVADFEPVPPETVLEQPTIDFTNNSSSSESLLYDWNFGDGNTSTEQSPSHSYSEVGIYLVKLLVTTPNDCVNEIEKEVIIHPDIAVHAPNAFTPNGDGLNDVFEIKGVGINEYLLQVYSRWGELIYESKNLEDQWDGKFNGELVPAGTYVYTINYKSMLNRDYNKKGSVTVVR